MIAEVYQYDVGDDGPTPLRGQVVHDAQMYWEPGFGADPASDLERIVTVFYGRVEILSGRVAVGPLVDGKQGVNISDAKHVASLRHGDDPHIEELTGPDGERRLLHVRGRNVPSAYPHKSYFFKHPARPDMGVGFVLN